MPLQTTSGAASYDAFGGGVPIIPNYIEEVFSTYLWTGNGTTQTITNDIDLSTKGGLVWSKNRAANTFGSETHELYDTTRGTGKALFTNNADAQENFGTARGVTAFSTSGFTVKNGSSLSGPNSTNITQVGWTFRKQPKFFDVVTYTGNGTAGRTVAHNLGSVPACIIVKRTSGAANWIVYHRSTGNTKYLILNGTALADNDVDYWSSTTPTSTNFTVNSYGDVNASGSTYVAYLFAHDAGGFGLTGTDNVISCGSFTTGAYLSITTVNLGYEPQWVMFKSIADENWWMVDNMRGMPIGSVDATLNPNLSSAESFDYDIVSPTATGFTTVAGSSLSTSDTYIYIAIRRGPMKVPTSGTSVFSPNAYTGGTAGTSFNLGFVPDTLLTMRRNTLNFDILQSRLTGLQYMFTNATDSETTASSGMPTWDANTGTIKLATATSVTGWNGSGSTYVNEAFARAPSFFDVVCYTGTGANPTSFTHNLGVVPEMMIIKCRGADRPWPVYHVALGTGAGSAVYLDSNAAGAGLTFNTAPTSTVFTVTDGGYVNQSGQTYVNYLFATCAGVSKVGSYTGTGALQTVNCGFTSGARFVLIKKTSGTGSWYVWDSARGIVSGNDPYLLLNSTAAEVTSTDYIDTYSAGFEISSTAPSEINENGGSFIFLAIA